LQLIEMPEMPVGSRPLRALVGGFAEQFQLLNDVALQLQTAAIQQFGSSDLMSLRRRGRDNGALLEAAQ
jgi:hypothetical protein